MPQGTIKKVIADKGFGFIEMTNDDEGKKAISELNGKELNGRAIKVNAARPREERRNSW